VYSIAEFFYTLAILFSGQFIPLQLMPDAIQAVARYLPYQMCIYVPIEIILNKLPPAEMARDFAVGVVWLVLFAFIFRWMWREGVKRYSAVGA
jgi:ABC-2 type transport system permease protein